MIPTKQITGDVAVSRNVSSGGNMNVQGRMRVGHDLKVEGWLDARNIKGPAKGMFFTIEDAKRIYPQPEPGWWVLVGQGFPAQLWVYEQGEYTGDWRCWDSSVEAPDVKMSLDSLSDDVDKLKQLLGEMESELPGIRELIESVRQDAEKNTATITLRLDTLVSGNASEAIDNFNEIVAFLDGISDKESLQGILAGIASSISGKVDKVAGKGLSSNDYTSAEKTKLSGIEVGANKYVHPASHPASMIQEDSNHRFVTDTEREKWNELLDKDALTPWQKAYLENLEDQEVRKKFAVAMSAAPASKEIDGTATAVRLTVRPTYDGKGVDAVVTGKDGVVFSGSGGVYTADVVWAVPAETKGTYSRSWGAVVEYKLNGTVLSKDVSAAVGLYAQCRVLQTAGTDAPAAEAIKSAVVKRRSITGSYDITVVPGQYVWLCVPDGLTGVSGVTSSGFGVPLEEPVSVTVAWGASRVLFRCWRVSGAPQSSPMRVVVS